MPFPRLHAALLASMLVPLGCATPARLNTVAFPVKQDTLTCRSNGSCKMLVYARIGDSGQCEVMPEYDTMDVKASYTPKMVWRLKSIDTGHQYDYRFQLVSSSPPVYGIDILNNTGQDFDKPDYDPDPVNGKKDVTTFKWDNKHGRSLPKDPFPYQLNVERSLHNQDHWSPCDRVDPKIIND